MIFERLFLPKIGVDTFIPSDIELKLPENSELLLDQQHFLIYIPWKEEYLEMVPEKYRSFFASILHLLRARTTDVHTAFSMSLLPELLEVIDEGVNERVVAIALILHDSGWLKLSEKEIAMSLGVQGLKLNDTAIGPKEKHAQEGEKIAREVLANYNFDPALSDDEINLICNCILYHDKPEEVAGLGQDVPLEIRVLVDLDHIWAFTHQNFWQDTIRKGVEPRNYLENLQNDLDAYFVTDQGKDMARRLLSEREQEVIQFEQLEFDH